MVQTAITVHPKEDPDMDTLFLQLTLLLEKLLHVQVEGMFWSQ